MTDETKKELEKPTTREDLFMSCMHQYVSNIITMGALKQDVDDGFAVSGLDKDLVADVKRQYGKIEENNMDIEETIKNLMSYQIVYNRAKSLYKELKRDEKVICNILSQGIKISEKTEQDLIRTYIAMDFLKDRILNKNKEETVIEECQNQTFKAKDNIVRFIIDDNKLQRPQ